MANFIKDRNKSRRQVDRRADGTIKAVVTQHFKTDRQDVNIMAKPVRGRARAQEQ